MNTFMQNMTEFDKNFGYTENGGLKRKTTNSAVLDMFALCGAYRNRSEEDCIAMFKEAFEECPELALKCLFYLGDCRGGQGERRYFRVVFKWFARNYTEQARKVVALIPEYRRWDDLIYSTIDTPLENDMLRIVKDQLDLDIGCKTPSLLAKWMPSENASSKTTIATAKYLREQFEMSHKDYRKMLSALRERIKVVEVLMSENRWNEIEFDKIPSKAGLIYKNAFARRDIIAKKYEAFAKDENTKVNARDLYPYEVVGKAINTFRNYTRDNTDVAMLQKYWDNLPDYFNGNKSNILCVCDTSASMRAASASAPINIAISLSMYCAERAGGDFKNHYISFSHNPQLIEIHGKDFVEKVYNIYKSNLCEDTDLERTFLLLKNFALNSKPEDIPDTIVILSDMEINAGTTIDCWDTKEFNGKVKTLMESMQDSWAAAGLRMPRLVYWNVDARNNTILDVSPLVSYVSGCSATIFEEVIRGVTGMDLMLEKLNSERYAAIKL